MKGDSGSIGTSAARPSRDLVAFIGLAPLVSVVLAGALLSVAYGIFGTLVIASVAGPAAAAPLALCLAGAFAMVSLARGWWWLLATDKPLPLWARLGQGLGFLLAIAALVVGLRLHAAKAIPTWTSDEAWMLAEVVFAIGATALLTVIQFAARRSMSRAWPFKVLEILVFCAAWIAAVATVPVLQQREVDRIMAIDDASRRALRVETSSRNPFVIALCHDDVRTLVPLLEVAGDEGARDAWTCIPDNIAQYLGQHPAANGVAESRVMWAAEAVYLNDRRYRSGSRPATSCTVAEANLLRRVVDVSPTLLLQFYTRGLPTDCVEENADRTPIWWRIERHWPPGTSAPTAMLQALRSARIDLHQADAHGVQAPWAVKASQAASAP